MPRREDRLAATQALREQLNEHIAAKGCFNCGTTAELQIAHLHPAEALNPRKNCVYANDAAKQAKKVMEELKKCGILCAECHRSYDGHTLYGHPKVSWDQKFKDKGPGKNGANWAEWKREYLTLSSNLEAEIAE